MITEDVGTGASLSFSLSVFFPPTIFFLPIVTWILIGTKYLVLLFCCAGVHEYPFLYARIFTSVAKLSTVVTAVMFAYLSLTINILKKIATKYHYFTDQPWSS